MKMDEFNAPEIAKGVFSVGAKDWNRRMVDALIPIPNGTSYNSFLVKGEGKTALIDTVNRGFEDELVRRAGQVASLADLDYIVMNHAEPDHAGAIARMMQVGSKAMLIATKKGAKAAQLYYAVPEERIKTVEDGEILALGGKTLQFIDAPWLHWPETMFTYLVEDRILFSCDFFGMHTARDLYGEESEEAISSAKTYFGEIMMPFRSMGRKALDKISRLDIGTIAPGHGPIHKNPARLLDAYKKWTSGETREKAIVAYVSMLGSTEAMVKTMVETLLSEGVEVSVFNLADSDPGSIARDFVDARAIVLGTPTVLGGMHPYVGYAAYLIRMFRPPLRYCAILSSHGFGGGAVGQAKENLDLAKIEVVGTLDVNGPPGAEEHRKIIAMGKELAGRIKGEKEIKEKKTKKEREAAKAI
ncbi:MAG TPA: FprA family A-type flavoprotein [Dissulfurispiraceae bacterium]